jgi:hypothetical protein
MTEPLKIRIGNLGVLEALTIVFVVLKFTHVIDWSWWWVLAPLWIPLAILGAIVAFIGVGYLGLWLYERIHGKSVTKRWRDDA